MKKIILCLCILLLATNVQAKNNKDKDKEKSNKGYHGKELPPGLQKKITRGKQLPPGWQKKIVKGDVIDNILYPHLVLVPNEILKILPPLPPGVSYKKIEDKILKIHDINKQILDVLELDKLKLPLPH